MNVDSVPGMESGATKRNIVVALLYLLLLPFIFLAGIFYISYAVATNRHGLGDRLAASPLGRIPTIANGGIQAGATVLVLIILIVTILGGAVPADSGTDVGTDTVDSPETSDETDPAETDSGSGDEETETDGTNTDTDESSTGTDTDQGSGSDTTDESESDDSETGASDDSGTEQGGDDATDTDESTLTVDVVDVIDGDTMDVEYENGTEDTIRLLGVDTPETQTAVSPDEFEGIPDSEAGQECLRDYGDRASEFATERLAGETIEMRFDPAADRRGVFDRLLVYVFVAGENFNHQLLEEGYARVFDSQFSESDRFYSTESAAQQSQTGVWECRDIDDGSSNVETGESALAIAEIHADAVGDEYDNLNDEYIVFQNEGDDPLDLTGWAVEDKAGFEYEFPTGFTLQPGAEVTLQTGKGSDTDTDLYWGLERPVWNNGGDTIFVYNSTDEIVLKELYS